MDDNEFGGNRFLFGGNQDDDNDHLSNSDSDTDDSAESSVFRTFMGGSGDEPRLFGSGDSPANSSEPGITPDSVPHLNYKPEDLEFDEAYPLVLDKPIFKRFEPETDEVSNPQPEEAVPSIPEPDYTQPETAQPFYPDPAYPQPEEAVPSIPEPDYTQPETVQSETVQPVLPEPVFPQAEEAVPSIPEPDYTQPEEPAPYYPESDYTQSEEPAIPSEASFDAPAYDSNVSSDSNNVVEPIYANETDYSENIPYSENSDDASSYDSIDNSSRNPQRTDEFTDDEDEMSDTAFPLFLSFKANDSAASVSEAIREKNSQKTTDTASRSLSGKESVPKTPVDEKAYNRMMNEAEPQVFKPFEAPVESQVVYDVPSVKPQNAVSSKNAASDTAAAKPFFKPQETRPASASRPVETNPEASESADDSDSNTTVRPGTRYYPAAQQMGYAAPMPQRELNTKRKKKKHGPLILTLTAATILVAAFFIYTKLDIGTLLANGGRNKAVTTTASVTDETSASTVSAAATSVPTVTVSPKPVKVTDAPAAVVSVTAVPTSKATATPTPKATATPTPKATATPTPKATATPTPKATATPTPKATATPTPASGESAKTPSGFSTSITDGSAKGDTASFNILFKNLSKTDVSLFDGVEYITITFSTEGAPITSVASDSFTFTLDPKHANTFIGIPTDKEVIAKKDTKAVGITGVTDGKNVGKYSIKYYVKTY